MLFVDLVVEVVLVEAEADGEQAHQVGGSTSMAA